LFASWVMVANSNRRWIDGLYVPGAYYIATRSYALYLLHPEVLALQRRFLGPVPFVLYFSLALAGSLLLAEILYRSVEKPFMDLREKLAFSSSKR
ncbi:acyltransferase, partial [bacterium]|nr:acyltransferase [bacterium]